MKSSLPIQGNRDPCSFSIESAWTELLRVSPALSIFSTSPSVEPTNNAAERGLRGAVIYRKLSLGQYDLKTSKSLAVGTHALATKVSAPDGSGVVNTNGTTITITS